MAVTLTETVGASTANTYATAAEATAYFNTHPDNATWTGLADDDTRARYLIEAARAIDRLPIDGQKYDTTTTSGAPDQALRFPRSVDNDGGTLFIPDGVKDAQCEQALHLAKVGTTATRLTLQAQGVVEAEFDDIREKYTGTGSGAGWSSEFSVKAYRILNSMGYIKHGGLA